jgi:hypothetical protein
MTQFHTIKVRESSLHDKKFLHYHQNPFFKFSLSLYKGYVKVVNVFLFMSKRHMGECR